MQLFSHHLDQSKAEILIASLLEAKVMNRL